MKIKVYILSIALAGLFISCNDYSEDLQNLGKRLEPLEDSTLVAGESMRELQVLYGQLNLLTQTMLKHGYITNIDENSDGTYTIHLRGYFDGTELTDSVITLKNGEQGAKGADGKNAKAQLGIKQGEDGKFYWTFNDELLLDDNGNPIPVQGANGKDGKNGVDGIDGKNGKDADPAEAENVILPMVRINEDTRLWEISTDGGNTWKPLRDLNDNLVEADGKDGKDGKKGEDGKEDSIVVKIFEADDSWVFVVHVSPSGKETTLIVPKE